MHDAEIGLAGLRTAIVYWDNRQQHWLTTASIDNSIQPTTAPPKRQQFTTPQNHTPYLPRRSQPHLYLDPFDLIESI
jgi:hypothetical protein